MSDQSQGPGWWQASDGKWYSPETHPDYVAPPPPPPPEPPGQPRRRRRQWSIAGAVLLVLVGAAVAGALLGDDDDGDEKAETSAEEPDDRDRTTPTQRERRTTTTRAPREPRNDLTAEAGQTSGTDSIGTRYTSAGALVTNPNTTWAAYDVSVVFNLVGPGGEVLDTETARVPYIPPGATVPVAPLQIGFDIPVAPAGVTVDLTSRLAEDDGWDGVEFMTGDGIELQVSGATIHSGDYYDRIAFTATNPGTEVAEFASWTCAFRRDGVIVGGESSSISDPIVPGGSVQAEGGVSLQGIDAHEVICRAYA